MLPASTVPQSGQFLVSHHCRVSSMTYSLHLNMMIRQMVSRGLVYPLRVSRLTYTAPACACEQICAAALTAYSNPSQHFMMVEVSEPHAPSASEASHTRKKPGYTHKHPEGLTSAGPTWNFARVFVEGQEGKHTYARVC